MSPFPPFDVISVLKDRTFITTRPAGQSGWLKQQFFAAGAELLELPIIKIVHRRVPRESEYVFEQLSTFDWILFTSANAVHHFFHELKERQKEVTSINGVKVAVIGKKTGEAVEAYGKAIDFTGREATGKAFAQELKTLFKPEHPRVLWATGMLAGNALIKTLDTVAEAYRINLYETQSPDELDPLMRNRIKNRQYDLIFFFSPSAVNNFYHICRNEIAMREVKAACIGEITAKACRNKHIAPLFVPEHADSESLFRATAAWYQQD